MGVQGCPLPKRSALKTNSEKTGIKCQRNDSASGVNVQCNALSEKDYVAFANSSYLMQVLQSQNDLPDVDADLALGEVLPLVEMGEELTSADIVWGRRKIG